MLVSFDTETHMSQPGLVLPPIVCVSYATESGCHIVSKETGLARLRAWLLDPKVHLIGCNIAYDMGCAAVAQNDLLPLIFAAYDDGRVHDIAIREALIDIAKGELVDHGDEGIGVRYGMRLLVSRYFDLDISEEKTGGGRKRYAELEFVPMTKWPWLARRYPMRDVAFPLEIFQLQEGGQNLHAEPHECRAAFALQLCSAWGIRANGDAVKALRARVEATDLANTIEFQKAGILRENGTQDNAALGELVSKAYRLDPPRTTTGRIASDRDTLAESGDELLERYATAGKNDKFLTTYLPILESGVEQPWNPQFNVLVATTRVSSDAQQFPQNGGVRECWEARPGYVFASVDFGGLELRTMSQRAIWSVGFSKMAEALNAGLDPHLIAAASFMGISYDEAKASYKAGDKRTKSYRDLGKTWNFSKGGGGGAGAMVYSARSGKNGTTTAPDSTVYAGSRFCILTGAAKHCGVSKTVTRVQGKQRRICAACLEVAKKLDVGWLSAWTEQKLLFEKASAQCKGRQCAVMIPVSEVRRGQCGYTQWLNTPFQGLGAAATKASMWRISREMYTKPESPLWGSRLVLNVHDELIAEMPEDRASSAGDHLAYLMRETLKEYVPDLAASVEAEPALSRTMAKGAKTVRDASGKLLVWEP